MNLVKNLVGATVAVFITFSGVSLVVDSEPNNDAVGIMLTAGGAGYFGIKVNDTTSKG